MAQLTSLSVDSNAGGRLTQQTWALQERVKVRVRVGSKRGKARYRTVTRLEWVTIARGPFARHRFHTAGSYKVRLVVEDTYRLQATTTVSCKVARKKPKPAPVRVVAPSDITFAFGSCTVSSQGRTFLDSLRGLVMDAQELSLGGNTDSVGSDEFNMALSECRAKAVEQVLLAGLSAKQRPRHTVVRWYGFHNPVASNLTAAGRARNRRDDITIVPK